MSRYIITILSISVCFVAFAQEHCITANNKTEKLYFEFTDEEVSYTLRKGYDSIIIISATETIIFNRSAATARECVYFTINNVVVNPEILVSLLPVLNDIDGINLKVNNLKTIICLSVSRKKFRRVYKKILRP
jgi:hypothetical protein